MVMVTVPELRNSGVMVTVTELSPKPKVNENPGLRPDNKSDKQHFYALRAQFLNVPLGHSHVCNHAMNGAEITDQ